ncbi:DEAD/DEAH box helicase [Anopheles sinensis]|uniref:DEAD/DEAH box helicase n=1 Tax=Anopheles sinensis TaxID=74873 RepID=A0A084WAX2_ANOSI|nr:DEAD/DEAH box helicase [Anopheles sinensis]
MLPHRKIHSVTRLKRRPSIRQHHIKAKDISLYLEVPSRLLSNQNTLEWGDDDSFEDGALVVFFPSFVGSIWQKISHEEHPRFRALIICIARSIMPISSYGKPLLPFAPARMHFYGDSTSKNPVDYSSSGEEELMFSTQREEKERERELKGK